VAAAALAALPATASGAARTATAPERVARSGAVTSVSVVPGSGRAEVVVGIDGPVEISDFELGSPRRLVVDLTGARLGAPAAAYDRVSRGGITNITLSQHEADVVRLVLHLDGPREYTVSQGDGDVRVSVDGDDAFVVWSGAGARAGAASLVTSLDVGDGWQSDSTPRAKSGRGGQVAQQGRSTQPRITVTYQDADIRDVLAAFAAFSGRTIVVGRDVQGTVTAEIRDQPWDVALRAILGAQGLAASEEASGIISVDSYRNIRAKQASEPLVTRIVSVNYANASSLAPTVRTLLNSGCVSEPAGDGAQAAEGAEGAAEQAPAACEQRGSVASDSGTNSLIITAVASRVNDIVGYVRDLDVRTPQVAIKAKIIFVNRTDIEEIGLTYDLGTGTQFFGQVAPRQDLTSVEPVDRNGDGVPDSFRPTYTPVVGDRVDLGGRVFSAIANANNRVVQPALNVVYSAAIGKYTLTSFLDALQEMRLADLQAEPTIVTLDNRRAEILVGQEIPLRVLDASAGGAVGGQGGGNIPRATVTLKEAGINLSVTPHITNNRHVLMAIHAENSDAQLAGSDVGFIFTKQRADNQLLVADGQTAVIGGLTVTQVTRQKVGIPYLINLPFIGRLFGTTRTSEAKRDLLILVTPHIVDEGERPTPPGNGR